MDQTNEATNEETTPHDLDSALTALVNEPDDRWVTHQARITPFQPVSFPVRRKGAYDDWCDRKTNTLGAKYAAGAVGPDLDLVTEPLVYSDIYDLGGQCFGNVKPPRIYLQKAGSQPQGADVEYLQVDVDSIEEVHDPATGRFGTVITYTETRLPWDEHIAAGDHRREAVHGPDDLDRLCTELVEELKPPVG